MADSDARHHSSHPGAFKTTHWSLIRTAQGSDTTNARAALNRLCIAYWYPVYAFIRRSVDDGNIVRRLLRLLLEQRVEARTSRKLRFCAVPITKKLLALSTAEHRESSDSQPRVGDDLLQKDQEVSTEP